MDCSRAPNGMGRQNFTMGLLGLSHPIPWGSKKKLPIPWGFQLIPSHPMGSYGICNTAEKFN